MQPDSSAKFLLHYFHLAIYHHCELSVLIWFVLHQNAVRKDLENLEGRIQQLGEKANNDFKATLQRVEPTFKSIEKAYSDDLVSFYKEIADDKVLKELSEAL